MAEYTTPTLEESHKSLLADIGNRVRGLNLSRFSDAWKRLRTIALAVTGLHYHIAFAWRQLMPDTATGTYLDRWGAVFGVARMAATAAQKADALRIYGTAGSVIADGTEAVHEDGTTYETSGANTIPAGGTYVDCDVVATTLGSAGRKQAGEDLTLSSPPAGCESTATLVLDIDEDGEDAEEDGPYRKRILTRSALAPMGGNAADFEAWVVESGMRTGYCYPRRNGLGTVDVVGLHGGSGSDRIPSAPEVLAIQAYVEDVAPVDCVVRALTVTAQEEDADIVLLPEDGYTFDWTDGTTGTDAPLVVDTWTAGTRTLKFTTARPDDMAVGDRLVYVSTAAPYGDGREMVIESLSSTDSVVLVEDDLLTDAPPVAGDYVYSGGPLVEPVRQAVLAVYDALGPGTGSYGTRWSGDLRQSTLFKAAQTTEGVLDSDVLTPATNVVAACVDPNASVSLIVPRQVVVRRWW